MTELEPRRPGRPSNAELAARQATETVSPPNRPARKPFSSTELKLAYPSRDGYHRHWFNDTNNRVARALEAGYEHVKDREGKSVSRVVGTAEGGGALWAFLMEIPEDWYKEDMAREEAVIAEKEAAIKRGQPSGAEVEQGYVPSQGISIRRA